MEQSVEADSTTRQVTKTGGELSKKVVPQSPRDRDLVHWHCERRFWPLNVVSVSMAGGPHHHSGFGLSTAERRETRGARMTERHSPGSTQALCVVLERAPSSQGDGTPSKPLPSKRRSVQDLTKRQIAETGGELAEEEVPQSRRESRPRLKYVVMDEDDLERCFCRLPMSRNVIQNVVEHVG